VAGKLMLNFGYLGPASGGRIPAWITKYNKIQFDQALLQKQLSEPDCVMMNESGCLLRTKSSRWPFGRLTQRFKDYLRSKVTIVRKK
jgi:hypothetical protein